CLKASAPISPWSKSAFWVVYSRSASCSLISACVTPAWTSERVCAWLTSGSTSASTSPLLTTAPSRTLSARTRPETADLTSTLVTGSTTPTSRTETWRGSSWTLPSRKGLGGVLSLPLSRLRAATIAPPATSRRTIAQIPLFLLLVLTPSRSWTSDSPDPLWFSRKPRPPINRGDNTQYVHQTENFRAASPSLANSPCNNPRRMPLAASTLLEALAAYLPSTPEEERSLAA